MLRWIVILVGFGFCIGSWAQTNAPDSEYGPPSPPPTKPSPWLPYGLAGVPEQLIRFVFSPAEWAANRSSQSLSGLGTSPFSSEQPSQGMYPQMGFTPAQGFALGAGYYDQNFTGASRLLRLEGMAATGDAERLSLSFARPVARARIEIGAAFDRDANREFYGFGNRTEERHRTYFEQIEGRGWISVQQPLPAGLAVRGSVLAHALTFDADGGEDSPRIRKRFALSGLPGFQADPDLVEMAVALTHHASVGPARFASPVTFSERAAFSRFESLSGDDLEFLLYSLSAEATIPLGKPRRELRARLHWEEARADGGNAVPFVFEPTLGENAGLRGFGRDRFRDNAAALANFEYRFPSWAVAQGLVFYDVGRVFRGSDHFAFDTWRWSAGFGAEIVTPSRFHAVITIGFSEEGVQPVFQMTRKF